MSGFPMINFNMGPLAPAIPSTVTTTTSIMPASSLPQQPPLTIPPATTTTTTTRMAPAANQKYRKAPDAPKRFKSAFIIFSAAKHKEIKANRAADAKVEKTTDVAKLVSEAWRELDPEEKAKWEAEAQRDKARYEVEKLTYKGPWKVIANKRSPKDPTAPKRPMSAFLSYSNKLRASLKRQNKNATNSDLSKMLAITWRELDDKERQKYVDEEAELRATYKINMAEWRQRHAEEKKAERMEREALALKMAEAQAQARPALEQAALQQQQQQAMAAASFQQQMLAAAAQAPQLEQPPAEDGQEINSQPAEEDSGVPPPEGLSIAEQSQQQNQDTSQTNLNGMAGMNMGMQFNPAMFNNNPYLAQMQLQQFLAQQQMGQNSQFPGMPANITPQQMQQMHMQQQMQMQLQLQNMMQQGQMSGMNQQQQQGQMGGMNQQQQQGQMGGMNQQQQQQQQGGQLVNLDQQAANQPQMQSGSVDPSFNANLPDFDGAADISAQQDDDQESPEQPLEQMGV